MRNIETCQRVLYEACVSFHASRLCDTCCQRGVLRLGGPQVATVDPDGPKPGILNLELYLQVATVDPDGWKYVFVDHQDFLKELETATGGEL